MVSCRLVRDEYKKRSCLRNCKGVSHDGQLTCDQDGRCTITSQGADFFLTFRRSFVTSNTLCRRGAIRFWCNSCEAKYMHGAMQFTTTRSATECEHLAQQDLLNIPCTCLACDGCSRCERNRMFCNCSAFDSDVTTQYSTSAVNTTVTEVTTGPEVTPYTTATASTHISTESNTKPVTMLTNETTQFSNQTTENASYTTPYKTTNSSYGVPGGLDMSTKALVTAPLQINGRASMPLLIGGILGGVVLISLVAILSALLCRHKVIQRKRKNRENSSLHETDAPYINYEMSTDVSSDRQFLFTRDHNNFELEHIKEQEYTNDNSDIVKRRDTCCNGSDHCICWHCTDQVYINTSKSIGSANDDTIYNVLNEDKNEPKVNEDEYGNLNTTRMNTNSEDDTIYNMLNEDKHQLKGNDDEYGHLRIFSKAIDDDDYDEFRQIDKTSFVEPEDMYDHTKAVSKHLPSVQPSDQDYDHIILT